MGHHPEGSLSTVEFLLPGQREGDLFTVPVGVGGDFICAQAIQVEKDEKPDRPQYMDSAPIQSQDSKGCLIDTMTFKQLMSLIQTPLASNNTARALILLQSFP